MDVGNYVIVRSSPSGCWAGTLVEINNTTVRLSGARRLWKWWAAGGVSLSGVASAGLHQDKLAWCKIEPPVEVMVYDVCEILRVTDAARASIEAAP
jgi:hypothetical protein